MVRITLITTLAFLSAGGAIADPQTDQHHHHGVEHFAAGEPGIPAELSRMIDVTMGERDGKMFYSPDKIEVREGETIQFSIHNKGELDHEFVLATANEDLGHAKAMEMNPEMAHQEPNARRVAPQQTATIIWKFTKPGQFEFACLIPGHRDAGMLGLLEVK